MPTHWESSKRPLFVRTVFVNGSRHAILSQEDPLCQLNATPSSRKQSRPSSCQSFVSSCSANSAGSHDSNSGKRLRNSKIETCDPRGDISNELQGCLVKLRLVLAAHEDKAKTKSERFFNLTQEVRKANQRHRENFKQKRKKLIHAKTNKKKSCDRYRESRNEKEDEISGTTPSSSSNEAKDNRLFLFLGYPNDFSYENNENVSEDSNYYYVETNSEVSSLTTNCCCEKDASLIEIRDLCCLEGYHDVKKDESILSHNSGNSLSVSEKTSLSHNIFFPVIQGINNDISWNSISSDSYFTRPFYNPLSERVLQWLDLASKRRESLAKAEKPGDVSLDTIERIFEGNTFLDKNNMSKYREKTKTKKSKIIRSKSEGKVTKSPAKEPAKMIRQISEKKEPDAEEVKQEDDVETALSNEVIIHQYPKYRKELNRLHSTKSVQDDSPPESEIAVTDKPEPEPIASIPEKSDRESSVSAHLQESIMNSFNSVVTLNEQKSEPSNHSFKTYHYFPHSKPKRYQTTTERRTLLTRQSKLQESSDDDDDSSLKARKMDCWNKTQVNVKQRRNAFSHRNSMFNKTIECNSGRNRRDSLRRQKNRSPSLQLFDVNNENQKPGVEYQTGMQSKAIFHQNPLSARLQNKIPWLRDYQTGGRNMWPSEKAMNKPQLHIFMPAIPPKISESGTGEDSISDCDSFSSEICF